MVNNLYYVKKHGEHDGHDVLVITLMHWVALRYVGSKSEFHPIAWPIAPESWVCTFGGYRDPQNTVATTVRGRSSPIGSSSSHLRKSSSAPVRPIWMKSSSIERELQALSFRKNLF